MAQNCNCILVFQFHSTWIMHHCFNTSNFEATSVHFCERTGMVWCIMLRVRRAVIWDWNLLALKVWNIIVSRELGPKLWPCASYLICKIAGAHAMRIPGTFSPPQLVSDPDMQHDTCVTQVPWCMPGSLTSGSLWSQRQGKTFPAFPVHAQPAILRIWQEAHWCTGSLRGFSSHVIECAE